MKIEDIYHVFYDLSLGKCNMSLRSWLLLSNRENFKQVSKLWDGDPYNSNIKRLFREYNWKYITPDGLLYHNDDTHMTIACDKGDINIVRQMLKKNIHYIDCYTRIVIDNEHIDILHLLIPHMNNYCLNEGLCRAAKNKNLKIVQLMLDNGATDLYDCLKFAAIHGSIDIVQLMIDYKTRIYDIHVICATCNGHLDIVQLFIHQGCKNFDLYMIEAASHGHLDIAKLLIEHGVKNFNKYMRCAVITQNIEMVKLMITHGANNFDACMNIVVSNRHITIDIAKLMISHGVQNFNKYLITAVRSGNYEVVKLLLTYGANNFDYCRRMASELKHKTIVELIQHQMIKNNK